MTTEKELKKYIKERFKEIHTKMLNKQFVSAGTLIRFRDACIEFGKQEQKKRDVKLIEKWFNDDKTCSGKPHCSIEDCDLCANCYIKLLNKFGYTWENGKIKQLQEELEGVKK